MRANEREGGLKGPEEETGVQFSASGQKARGKRKDVEEILLVEDDRDLVQDLLASWDAPCPVSVVATGKDAFEYLEKYSPALVLLDLILPRYLATTDGMEGLEILSHIRREIGGQLPVIVISREEPPDAESSARHECAQGYLQKPLDLARLSEVVARLMRRDSKRASERR
jgi:CheY-like chemotaxis protein